MSSNEIKDDLVYWYGGKSSDWKRKTKKKKGSYTVRVFENKKLGITKQIVSSDDEDYIKPEYFPNGEFWIYINQNGIDINDVDERKTYFDENFKDNIDGEDENPIVVLKAPGGDFWYDQHSSELIEEYFGVEDFCSNFEEPCENLNILTKDIPLKNIRESMEKVGMKFLGYRTREE